VEDTGAPPRSSRAGLECDVDALAAAYTEHDLARSGIATCRGRGRLGRQFVSQPHRPDHPRSRRRGEGDHEGRGRPAGAWRHPNGHAAARPGPRRPEKEQRARRDYQRQEDSSEANAHELTVPRNGVGQAPCAREREGSRAPDEAQQLRALLTMSLASVPKNRAVGDPYWAAPPNVLPLVICPNSHSQVPPTEACVKDG
jgi:hypothetical protein